MRSLLLFITGIATLGIVLIGQLERTNQSSMVKHAASSASKNSTENPTDGLTGYQKSMVRHHQHLVYAVRRQQREMPRRIFRNQVDTNRPKYTEKKPRIRNSRKTSARPVGVQRTTTAPKTYLSQAHSNPTPNPNPNPNPKLPIHPALNKKTIRSIDQKTGSEVIYALPKRCRNTLKNAYIRYQPAQQRALGGKSSIIMTGLVANEPDSFRDSPMLASVTGQHGVKKGASEASSRDELRALWAHELGHVADLGCITGTLSSGMSEFKDGEDLIYNDDPSVEFYRISWSGEKVQRSDANKADFMSGYASWDAFEDFAETYNAYFMHRDYFKQRAGRNVAIAAKYAWFEKYFGNEQPIAITKFTDNGTVPWDMTKLPAQWVADVEVTLN